MNIELTEIAIVLDRSGSMADMKSEAILKDIITSDIVVHRGLFFQASTSYPQLTIFQFRLKQDSSPLASRVGKIASSHKFHTLLGIKLSSRKLLTKPPTVSSE